MTEHTSAPDAADARKDDQKDDQKDEEWSWLWGLDVFFDFGELALWAAWGVVRLIGMAIAAMLSSS